MNNPERQPQINKYAVPSEAEKQKAQAAQRFEDEMKRINEAHLGKKIAVEYDEKRPNMRVAYSLPLVDLQGQPDLGISSEFALQIGQHAHALIFEKEQRVLGIALTKPEFTQEYEDAFGYDDKNTTTAFKGNEAEDVIKQLKANDNVTIFFDSAEAAHFQNQGALIRVIDGGIRTGLKNREIRDELMNQVVENIIYSSTMHLPKAKSE
jgi:hypothetical protein